MLGNRWSRRSGGRRTLATAMTAGFAAGAILATSGCQTSREGAASARSSREILEVDVTNLPDRVNGQPVVAVNPRKRDNLVFVSTSHIGGETLQLLNCFVAHSEDGGATWTSAAWPYGDRPYCGDPYLAVGSMETFFIAFNRLGCPGEPKGPLSAPCAAGPGQIGVARSSDGGRTWSAPVDTPVARATTPRLRVDRATDRVYAVGGMGPPSPHAVSVSADHGLTWSPKAALPNQPFGNQIAVHDGILATATAMKVLDRTAVASEVTFFTSVDDGRTFSAHPVTDGSGARVRPAEGPSVPNNQTLAASDPIPWITADPTRRGRFAIMIPRGEALEVYVTADAGTTWTGPAAIAAPGAELPWIEFGSTGLLGVMWRVIRDDALDVFSAVSFDRGRSFSQPLKVNRTTQRYGFKGTGGDEWSRILLDDRFAYVTWADGRNGGEIDGIFSRVPLSVYRERQR